MTKQEFKEAFALATSDTELTGGTVEHFCGFGLPDFQPVPATLQDVAMLIRHQAIFFDGSVDREELTSIMNNGRRRFQIIG